MYLIIQFATFVPAIVTVVAAYLLFRSRRGYAAITLLASSIALLATNVGTKVHGWWVQAVISRKHDVLSHDNYEAHQEVLRLTEAANGIAMSIYFLSVISGLVFSVALLMVVKNLVREKAGDHAA